MTMPFWFIVLAMPLAALGLVAAVIIIAVIFDVTQNPKYDR